MRPVLLEMAGFASFREPTVVDFARADYFALVGPTGAGKSTVIDAITFALYGSVPRWDNQRTVALALAPTAGRGTVRLLFDVGGSADERSADAPRSRYVVARELRRAASGAVSVRSARLERLRDPAGLGGVDEDTEPLADGAGGVTAAVEALLGLPFGDFTTCVVLPQGDFAEFLHTEPRKRQEKLVRILGLGIYDQIAREANTDAAAQRQRAEVLTEQLDQYADATTDAEQAAAARVAALEALAERVDALVPEVAAAEADAAAAEADAARIRAEGTQLAGLVAPADLDDLDVRRTAATAAVEATTARATAADDADTAAREALAAAPDRGPLERARAEHAELVRLTAERPGSRERHEKARAFLDTATRDAADARTALDAARAAGAAAVAATRAAHDRVATVTEERDRLRSLAVPAGLDELDGRRTRAVAALDRAAAALHTAESADNRARDALAAAPPRGPLEQARRQRAELADVERERREAAARLDPAQRGAEDAAAGVERTRHALEHVESARAAAVAADLAGALRPTLAVGEPCPVCAQAVATLPPALPAGDLAGADAAVAAATREHDAARREEVTAATALARVTAEVERLDQHAERLRRAATDVDVEAVLADLDRREQEVQDTDTAARAARRHREAAARELDAVRADLSGAAAALRSARDPLVPFGAPAVRDDDVLAGWTALVGWATGQASERDAALAAGRAEVAAAEAAQGTADAALHVADRVATERRHDETAAARAEQEAAGLVAAVGSRLDELRAFLDGAPTDAEAARGLERRAELEAAARAADADLRATRAARRDAERVATDVARDVSAAWLALRAARDPLVPLGAPVVHGDDLGAAWRALAGWAQAEVAERRTRFATAEGAARRAREVRDAATDRLRADLAAHQIPAGEPTGAPATVAAALERARGAGERIAERRAVAARIVAERDAAQEAAQVAKMLGGLLRSDGFPRWLVASALDALVADASASLAELSAGQFALTHDHGEFLVIDHADADARRPVKTLSGGETFQASLALALALSAQMAGLAAEGAARLDSIFLDEGFGTLDEANLETVAGTLENLAARGDRMVGVVTHVPALAERVPVRFRVSRDQSTSSVEREDL